jgi:N-methylhydantoinase A
MPEVPPPSAGSLKAAQIDEAEVYFAANGGGLKAHKARFYERSRLPVGARVTGPAVLLQIDSTTLVPPGASAEVLKTGDLLIRV